MSRKAMILLLLAILAVHAALLFLFLATDSAERQLSDARKELEEETELRSAWDQIKQETVQSMQSSPLNETAQSSQPKNASGSGTASQPKPAASTTPVSTLPVVSSSQP